MRPGDPFESALGRAGAYPPLARRADASNRTPHAILAGWQILSILLRWLGFRQGIRYAPDSAFDANHSTTVCVDGLRLAPRT